ncbi:cAMP-dependent protein kinase regulatory subunit [Trichophyton equinum CBS 127.97]|uniref:cAMP-dependent protein kinase regulatory subunit n=1 Tax=Trichophyton equinum (strain ATCC MYA-4606 / CBS 127.97) TaxID=559882 RepID=F2PJ64_TRIEC|nr:cAMP-dependent protein kinase regulatory subunit [Trichophyton equinum CBS 127.97]
MMEEQRLEAEVKQSNRRIKKMAGEEEASRQASAIGRCLLDGRSAAGSNSRRRQSRCRYNYKGEMLERLKKLEKLVDACTRPSWKKVPLLSSLKPYERSKIADALDTVKHPSGATIIAEGEPGESFYLLESGEAVAYKAGIEGPVKEYKRGDYFGELALLDDKPRQATVVSKTEVKVAKLGRDGFKRLLGPVEEIMRREDYGTASATDSEAGKEQKGT